MEFSNTIRGYKKNRSVYQDYKLNYDKRGFIKQNIESSIEKILHDFSIDVDDFDIWFQDDTITVDLFCGIPSKVIGLIDDYLGIEGTITAFQSKYIKVKYNSESLDKSQSTFDVV